MSTEHRPNVLCSVLHNTLLTEREIRYSRTMTEWLTRRGIQIQSIVFPDDAEPSDLALAAPVLRFVAVIHLIDCLQLTNKSVQLLLQKCGSLESLVLAGCSWLEDETLRIVAKHHPDLQQYILGDCPLVTDAGVAHVLLKCPEIAEVQWDGCEHVGKQAMAALENHTILSLFITTCPNVSDASLVKFFQNNKNKMDTIVMSENEQLTDKSLLAMAQHCPGVLDINISECPNFTDTGLCAVIESCHSLTALRANDCRISAAVLDRMSTEVSPHLATLWLMPCPALTQKHVQALVQRAPGLIELRFSTCEGLNNRALQTIGAGLHALQMVTFEMCGHVGLEGVKALVRGCAQLVELHLLMCPSISDSCLEEIAVHCKNLRHLRVADNDKISDSGVRALALHCRQLEQVCFSYTSVTDVAVEHLIESCPAMATVVLQGRQAVAQSLVRLCARRGVVLTLADEENDEFEEMMQLAMDEAGIELESEEGSDAEEEGWEEDEEVGVGEDEG